MTLTAAASKPGAPKLQIFEQLGDGDTPRKVLVSMNCLEQFTRLHFQRTSNFPDVTEADVLAAPFNAPNIRGMESG